MNEEPSKHPIALDIDVNQWRRDIRTFSETTFQALDTIISQLSTSCSPGHDDSLGQFTTDTPRPAPAIETNESRQDDRLEKLKSQLANRISKTN